MACRVWARVGRLPVGVRWGCTLGAHATGATAAGRRAVAAVAVRWWDQHAWSHSSATRLYSTTPHTRVGVSNDRHGVATSVIPQPSVNAKLALLCRGEDFQAAFDEFSSLVDAEKADLGSHILVMDMYQRKDIGIPKVLITIYMQACALDVTLDLLSYNSVLTAIVDDADTPALARLDQASDVVQTMRARGISPDSRSYECVIDLCISAGQTNAALFNLKAMRDAGYQPSAYLYETLVEMVQPADASPLLPQAARVPQRLPVAMGPQKPTLMPTADAAPAAAPAAAAASAGEDHLGDHSLLSTVILDHWFDPLPDDEPQLTNTRMVLAMLQGGLLSNDWAIPGTTGQHLMAQTVWGLVDKVLHMAGQEAADAELQDRCKNAVEDLVEAGGQEDEPLTPLDGDIGELLSQLWQRAQAAFEVCDVPATRAMREEFLEFAEAQLRQIPSLLQSYGTPEPEQGAASGVVAPGKVDVSSELGSHPEWSTIAAAKFANVDASLLQYLYDAVEDDLGCPPDLVRTLNDLERSDPGFDPNFHQMLGLITDVDEDDTDSSDDE